jgi:hypothetical protein
MVSLHVAGGLVDGVARAVPGGVVVVGNVEILDDRLQPSPFQVDALAQTGGDRAVAQLHFGVHHVNLGAVVTGEPICCPGPGIPYKKVFQSSHTIRPED